MNKLKNYPKITIVTVTYNAEAYLEKTIINILEQDYSNIEYIIIDGASTDSTIDIIKKYEKKINYWISEPDNGIYDAMNKAIDIATGEWINFMNAGDTFVNSSSISKVSLFLKKDFQIIAGDFFYINNETRNSEYRKANGTTNIFNAEFCCHQSMFTNINLMRRFPFCLEYSVGADYDFMLKAHMNNYKFHFVNFPIINYLGGGFSDHNLMKLSIERLHIISKYTTESNIIFDNDNIRYIELNKPKGLLKNLNFSILLNLFESNLKKMDLENKKFILYGFGIIGKMIYNRHKESIVSIVDINNETISLLEKIQIEHPDKLTQKSFDYILISVLGRENLIKEMLIKNYGIETKKILEFDL